MDQETPRPPSRAQATAREASPSAFALDLALYISVMFLIREVSLPSANFIANGLFWSLTTLAIAKWRMMARGITWRDLGLRKPAGLKPTLIGAACTLGLAIGFIIGFEMLKDVMQLELTPETPEEIAGEKFGPLKGNWGLFAMIMPAVLLESFLEELLDRGFILNWIERSLRSTWFATVIAVVLQAMIFGFRHSNDVSDRSLTVGLIGLAMGIGYVAFGRNLWPVILAHCFLNTVSMVDRVG